MKRTLIVIGIVVTMLLGVFAGSYYYINKKIFVPSPKDFFSNDNNDNNDKQNFNVEKGNYNILLIGLDKRTDNDIGRTDSIILANINADTRKIRLISFMRDMYIPIPGYGLNRINSAYTLGGPELLMETLQKDFNIDVQYYISIDFRAFQDLVDKLGGIDVEIKDYEVNEINKYIKEVNGSKATLLQGPGYQHLNGQQALSYSRIRKVGNSDFERTERQRRVLTILIDKARSVSIFKIPELASTAINYIKTNIPTTKLMNLGYTVYKFGNTPVETIRIPVDGMFDSLMVKGMAVLVPDMEKNVTFLEKFLSSQGIAFSNLPPYMANNFHADDKAIDNRGKKRNVIKIQIPPEDLTQPTDNTSDYEIIEGNDSNNQDGKPNTSNTDGQGDKTNNNGNEVVPSE
ncbi:Regulatory protein MsrR [Caloramator mitchellensis]|uniref:Regulatory protein MsrR n=1 Tax=Caloramator mitchellensis TaxID=908809 RepID=A0A0R3JWS6_CALMK|nr:LCP family protein [Caloramator mitchellensis]KRQ87976.1 Regulatory protein MsrR [Caloramator mitchellensis]